METFTISKCKDLAQYGQSITKQVVFEIHDAIQRAVLIL